MKHATFNNPVEVQHFINVSASRKMHGVCVDNDGKYHLFYTESSSYDLDEEIYDEE